MLRDKVTLTHYLVVDSVSGEYLFLPSTASMTANQAVDAERDPELIRQAAVHLAQQAGKLGLNSCRVHALALVSLNGRRPVPIIDPTVDLTQARRRWFVDEWVTDAPGVLPKNPWLLDKEEWWKELVIPDPFKPLQGRTPAQLQEYLKQLDESRSETS